jgi:hypothetical protein
MNIESLEINLFKTSELKDGDTILVKIDTEEKAKLKKEDIQDLYSKLTKIIDNKNINIYFFPKNMDIDIIKNHVILTEEEKEKIQNNEK